MHIPYLKYHLYTGLPYSCTVVFKLFFVVIAGSDRLVSSKAEY